MTTDSEATGPVGNAVERITGLVELVTTLDRRLDAAQESLDEMRRTMAGFDELRSAVMEKLEELDLGGLGPRLERLEKALFNIEKATVNLDRSFEGGLEALPDFVTRKIKSQGKEPPPTPTSE